MANEFASEAREVDDLSLSPAKNLQKLAKCGFYKFVVEASPGRRRRALDLLSSGCGATAFLSTQHEGVCRRLSEAGHPSAQSAIEGEEWYGVCFAHLRRDPSPVSAIRSRHHVVFSGRGPWFSGHGLMTKVLVGGATETGDFLMGIASMDEPEIVPGRLDSLAVMEATATVALDFNALQIANEDILVKIDATVLAEKDMHSTVFQSARSLGVARAASRFLDQTLQSQVLEKIDEHHGKMDAWDENPDWEGSTQLRFEALQLADRVVGAAYAAVGGKAHLLSHPLQRIAREAHFYSTTQLTKPLREKVLESLQQTL
ncbi:MAG: hypothetical protein KC800_16585 [Candidatus Eremiobacteraeota bacterium]|nr:hypothetical protein [Candidatus Eremiobacteraeota bacterium]